MSQPITSQFSLNQTINILQVQSIENVWHQKSITRRKTSKIYQL